MELDAARIPITVITGFLGAGKTTLIKHILHENHGKRIAVVQNEVGAEISVEAAVLVGKDGTAVQEILELPNGCVCCSVRGDLLAAIETLVQRKDRLDYIFIEPSGMADPGAVASALWVDDELGSQVYLDGIITVVDSKHILLRLDEQRAGGEANEAQRQIAFADRLILNKTDLVTSQQLDALEQRLRTINPLAHIVRTQYSRVPLPSLLHLEAFKLERALEIDPLLLSTTLAPCEEAHHNAAHEHSEHCGRARYHDDTVRSVSLIEARPVVLERFTRWVGDIVWEGGGGDGPRLELFRIKGQVHVAGDECRYAVQGVHALFEVLPTTLTWPVGEPRLTRLLLIGRHLDPDALARSFVATCCAED